MDTTVLFRRREESPAKSVRLSAKGDPVFDVEAADTDVVVGTSIAAFAFDGGSTTAPREWVFTSPYFKDPVSGAGRPCRSDKFMPLVMKALSGKLGRFDVHVAHAIELEFDDGLLFATKSASLGVYVKGYDFWFVYSLLNDDGSARRVFRIAGGKCHQVAAKYIAKVVDGVL
jgi:hypothetical protein